MRDLTAQVTSSLLPFPGVTIDALGEDEITLDSVLHGKFTVGRTGLAWLACGPHLEVVHAITGERLSAYCFSGGGEHPPIVLAARDFSWLKRSGLLVGLEEAEGSVLCLYDLGLSRVVKAVVIPGRISAIEPLVSYGGASTLTQHLHQSLRWFFGIAAVVTDVGHVLLVDLCLDDLSCSQSELEASDLQVVTKSPSEIPRLREPSTRQGRHLCLQLNGPTGVGATAVQYISRTNQLAVGFSDGFLQLWNMKSLKKEYHSQLEGGRVPVYAFTFQEPENDPRNCCYLWAVQSSQDLEGDMVSLHLLQLAFSERKCLASGKILYEGLEYCEERYSQELSGSAFPLRAQASNTHLLSCQTIEKFRPHPDRDDSMNEAASPDTSVSLFTWQVKAYGQGTPSTYIGVFDINRWYHAQMPDSLRAGESLQNCPYLAVWSLEPMVQMVSSHVLLDAVVHDRSLSRGLPFTCPPPEQYFNPTTYNFDVSCLLNSGIVHLTCSGYQKETLSFLKKAAPCSSDVVSTSYSRCLMSGLLSSRLADTQSSSLSQEEQLDAILSTAVETSSLGLITGCIKKWTAEEQPGSALNLRYILDWAWNKVVQTKEELDGICAPLFDSSSNFTDPQTMQLLQHSQRLLGNLSTIFHCLLSEAQELTQKGLVGLMNKNMVSSLISKYAQVVLWFCRTGLLPEGSDDDSLQISRPFYSHSVISNYYTIRREELTRLAKGKWCADCLMIDGLVGHCGECLTSLWKRDEGGTGQYPPPTLHALLDIYLLDNIDEAAKQAIVIYLLLDVMYSFPNKDGSSVESFPTAFAIPIGLVKLVQGLWLLDHNDQQSSFELLLHPAVSQCQFEWQHERILQALMCQGQHSEALRYFHIIRPPISSTSCAKLCMSVLLHNRCLIEAWSLLRRRSNHLSMGELLGFLYESCQELGLIKELLKLPLSLNEQECLERFLQGTGGLQNRELLMVHYLQQAKYIPALQLNHSLKMNLVNERDPKLKERSNTRNSILDQYGKVLPTVQRKLALERAKPYQHPRIIHRELSRPQPLSTITKRSASEKVMSRAGFINNVLTKIEEVWLGNGATPHSSPASRATDIESPKPSSSAPLDPFLGTPITMSSKRKSRIMDMVVHPSCQTPRPLLNTPRPPSSWVSPKSTRKAPELNLLQTPQVVKRARALAASGPVFSAFTPQSILRSSLRPTPVVTPSASPGRSITPPLRTKESRITFIEEGESPEPEKSMRWTNGMAAVSEISLLSRGSMLSKAKCKTWSSLPAEEEEDDEEVQQPSGKVTPPECGLPPPLLRCFESESVSIRKVTAESRQSDATQARLSLSFDTSQMSVRSTDTTLEFFDAPLLDEQQGEEGHIAADKDDDIVTVNIKCLTEKIEPEEKPSPTIGQIPQLTEDLKTDEEGEAQEEETFEDVLETGVEQEAENEEVQCVKEDELDIQLSSKQEDAVTLDQEDNQVCYQITESTDSSTQVESQDQPVTATGQDIQSGATESTEFPQHPKLSEASEPTAFLEHPKVSEAPESTEFPEHPKPSEAPESTEFPEHLKPSEASEFTEHPKPSEPTEFPEHPKPSEASEFTEFPEHPKPSEPTTEFPEHPKLSETSEPTEFPEHPKPSEASEFTEFPEHPKPSEPTTEFPEHPKLSEISEPTEFPEHPKPSEASEFTEFPEHPKPSEASEFTEHPKPSEPTEFPEHPKLSETSEPTEFPEHPKPSEASEFTEFPEHPKPSEPTTEFPEHPKLSETSEPTEFPEHPKPSEASEFTEYPEHPKPSEASEFTEFPEHPKPSEASEFTEFPEHPKPSEASEFTEFPEHPKPSEASEFTEFPEHPKPSEASEFTEHPKPSEPTEFPEHPKLSETSEPTEFPEHPKPSEASEFTEFPEHPKPSEPTEFPEHPKPSEASEFTEFPEHPKPSEATEFTEFPEHPKPSEASEFTEFPEHPKPSEASEFTEFPEHPKLSEAPEPTEFPEHLKASEPTSTPEEELEQSTDLTEFVQRHLFGSGLSPPLTRSGIHSASLSETSSNSESPAEVKEEEPADAEAPSVFPSQKSTPSITSSEPTGTDSHSVVSLNDSEVLSSPESEEEDEEESDLAEDDGEEEEEDSGSEVEIIEEVQGNGSLPPFSLIPPGAEMKMEDEPIEDEVVMVRLGAEEGGTETYESEEEQGSPYVELQPSTTLLVPVQLVGEQDGLADGSLLGLCELPHAVQQDHQRPETLNIFSLVLDMAENVDKEADVLPMENNLQFADPSSPSPVVEASVEPVVKPEVILLDTDDQDPLLAGEALEEDQRIELDIIDGVDDDVLTESEHVNHTDQADLQTENNVADHEPGDAPEQLDADLVMPAEDQEAAGLSASGPTPVVVDDDKDAVAETSSAEEQMVVEEDKPVENGVNTDTEIAPSAEAESVFEEGHQDHKASAVTEVENREEISMNKETKRRTRGSLRKHNDVDEESPVSNSQPKEQPEPEIPTSQKKKKAPITPRRRTTRGRTVTFTSPLLHEAEEPQEGGKEAETGTVVPAPPSRTARKSKKIKSRVSTPRRSTRIAQPEPPKDEEEEAAIDDDTAAASTSKASSPARRQVSQRAVSTRSSQSGSQDAPAAAVVETTEGVGDEVTDKKATRRKRSWTPTPAKRRTTQENTPRRSSRRILSSSEVTPAPSQILKEENLFESPVKRSSRKTKPEPSEVQAAALPEEEEEESKQQPVSSPSRRTRPLMQNTLDVYPQVKLVPISLPQSTGKLRGTAITYTINDGEALLEPEGTSNSGHTNSLRPARNKLWDHPKEDLPLLDTPLEINSETPVADALIRRLQEEEEKQEGGVVITKVTRTGKRTTKFSVVHVDSLQPVKDGLVPKTEEDETGPGEHSFIYSPSRRRTRANRTETPGPSEEYTAPVTRSSRRVNKHTSFASRDDIALEEHKVEAEKAAGVSKTREAGKRTAKSKVEFEPPQVAEVDLISPLSSPCDPLPRALKRILEGGAPTSSMNLRRKRMMDTVFSRPVTRRKKL